MTVIIIKYLIQNLLIFDIVMTIRSKGPQSEAKPFNVSSSSNSAVS